ncbi:MAG: molybdopterin-dependent oxidoreductase [Syntrophobacteraceae bacterium]
MSAATIESNLIATACGLCGMGCGATAQVRNGRLVKLTGLKNHPMNKGVLCARARNVEKIVYHPQRQLYPKKRTGDKWTRITWDEALDTIAARLGSLKEQYGARSLAVCFGFPVLTQGTLTISFMRRFCDVYGTPSVFSVDAMCWRSRLIGSILTFGRYPMPDIDNSQCILVMGSNPYDSFPTTTARVFPEALKREAKIIVVDPRLTPTAKKAHIHIQPRPGTDGIILLAMINVIIEEDLFDHDFVSKCCSGFDKLAEHIKPYTPEKAAEASWVPAERIREIARIFATTKPACIYSPNNALEESGNAVQNHRAISVLQAITGNYANKGGFITTSGLRHSPIRVLDLVDEKPLGADSYPLFYSVYGRLLGEGEGQTMLVPDAVLKGEPYPIRSAVVSGCNPVVTWPNSKKVHEAFKKLDFLVVMDMFQTPTADLADIFLPAATCFERYQLFDFYGVLRAIPYAQLGRPVIEPEGESWSDMKFYLELAKRMGFGDYFPWQNDQEIIDYMYQPTGLSVQKFIDESPEGLYIGKVNYKDYEKRNFQTPSGKVELYSSELAKYGHDPLPTYKEPPEGPLSTPERLKEYPLILTTGARKFPMLGSQFRQVEVLYKMSPGAVIEVNPDTAGQYGLQDGDPARLETRMGSIEVKVMATPDIMPGVVALGHGHPDANVNFLTDNTPADPISGFPSMKAMLCRLKALL